MATMVRGCKHPSAETAGSRGDGRGSRHGTVGRRSGLARWRLTRLVLMVAATEAASETRGQTTHFSSIGLPNEDYYDHYEWEDPREVEEEEEEEGSEGFTPWITNVFDAALSYLDPNRFQSAPRKLEIWKNRWRCTNFKDNWTDDDYTTCDKTTKKYILDPDRRPSRCKEVSYDDDWDWDDDWYDACHYWEWNYGRFAPDPTDPPSDAPLPSMSPSSSPSRGPTEVPTPWIAATPGPAEVLSSTPSAHPSGSPTRSERPTKAENTSAPTPVPSVRPSDSPSSAPTKDPTNAEGSTEGNALNIAPFTLTLTLGQPVRRELGGSNDIGDKQQNTTNAIRSSNELLTLVTLHLNRHYTENLAEIASLSLDLTSLAETPSGDDTVAEGTFAGTVVFAEGEEEVTSQRLIETTLAAFAGATGGEFLSSLRASNDQGLARAKGVAVTVGGDTIKTFGGDDGGGGGGGNQNIDVNRAPGSNSSEDDDGAGPVLIVVAVVSGTAAALIVLGGILLFRRRKSSKRNPLTPRTFMTDGLSPGGTTSVSSKRFFEELNDNGSVSDFGRSSNADQSSVAGTHRYAYSIRGSEGIPDDTILYYPKAYSTAGDSDISTIVKGDLVSSTKGGDEFSDNDKQRILYDWEAPDEYGSDANSSIANMSALDDVGLGSVLRLEEGVGRSDDQARSIEEGSSNGGGGEAHVAQMEFQDVWRRYRRPNTQLKHNVLSSQPPSTTMAPPPPPPSVQDESMIRSDCPSDDPDMTCRSDWSEQPTQLGLSPAHPSLGGASPAQCKDRSCMSNSSTVTLQILSDVKPSPITTGFLSATSSESGLLGDSILDDSILDDTLEQERDAEAYDRSMIL